MSNYQKGGNVAELVGPLLKRLQLAKERVPENSEMVKFIDQMSIEVEKIKDIFDSREKLDKELAGCLGKIEREIDPLMDREPCVKGASELQAIRHSLDQATRKCLDSLAIFPENIKLKKRFLTYCWSAFASLENDECEEIFSKLMDKHVLIPVVHREHNKVIDCFTIEPILHKQLISNRERDGYVIFEKREEGSWCIFTGILLNINQRYLDSKDIIDTMNKHEVNVVQLGSWHYTTEVHNGVKQIGSKETKLKDHIEVNQTDFLKKMGKNVHYVSLRGISGIVELPASIGKLEDLRVLDLRACHNLEKLPEALWFTYLEVLDISDCYLLVDMPLWIGGISELKVLKGFVVSSVFSDSYYGLSKLTKLQKLSIRFTNINSPDVFERISFLCNLLVLTITWRPNQKISTYSLPKSIEKLDIRCYPKDDLLLHLRNPGELTKLKRLYIRGGNLTKIPCHDNWKVEILRLRFLNKLVYPTDWEELTNSFKNLKYVEYVECTKPKNFPNDGHSWHNEE